MLTVNRATLMGHLGRDPEIRTARNNAKVATFSLATSTAWRDRDTGERRQRTEWHRIVVFPPALVEFAEKHLRKGSPVFVEGRIQTRKWADRDNRDRYVTEIVVQGYQSQLILTDKLTDAPPAANDDFAEPPATPDHAPGEEPAEPAD